MIVYNNKLGDDFFMTMKRRIFISNTIMVLISLLILFAVGGVSVKLFKQEIMDIIEQNAEIEDNIYDVQTLLMQQQKAPDTWDVLGSRLSGYGYGLYISDINHKKIYSNVTHSAMECIEELEKDGFNADNVKVYGMERITIARCIIQSEGKDYMIYAVCSPDKHMYWGIDSGVFEMFIVVFVIAGVIVIAGLLLCCQIFTRWMINRIMKPVDELNRAATRIKNGNLDEPVCYNEPDEFGEVCNTFNEMQKNLKEGMEKNIRYEKARTEMVSGISHDLRTPLTSVKGYIKGMIDGVANTPEKVQRYLQISYKKACDMDVLLQKLFFFSKLETGNMPFFTKEVNVYTWLDGYVAEKQEESREKNYNIVYKSDSIDDEVIIMADITQMNRVLNNIVENSLKYADVTDKQLNITVNVSVESAGNEVHIYVKDNGAGVPEDKLSHIFEQFYRGDESRSSKNDGSGLGLYVCRYIVEQQGGRIQAYNDNGLVMDITMPVFRKK